MGINKKDVKYSSDLQKYLQEQAKKSTRLYHYTTFESILCIIKNKNFRLSRLDLLNDKAEKKLGENRDHSENYIMSLTRNREYISMWAMYGRASGIKLRLDFNQNLFQKAIINNFYFDPKKKTKIKLYGETNEPDIFVKKDFLISDIVYMDKKTNELRHNEKSFSEVRSSQSLIEDVAGFIKYDAWEFERETRLRVRIGSLIQEGKKAPEYIFAGINDELINDFGITFNPWLSKELKEEIQNSLNRVAGCELKYNDSEIDGEVSEL